MIIQITQSNYVLSFNYHILIYITETILSLMRSFSLKIVCLYPSNDNAKEVYVDRRESLIKILSKQIFLLFFRYLLHCRSGFVAICFKTQYWKECFKFAKTNWKKNSATWMNYLFDTFLIHQHQHDNRQKCFVDILNQFPEFLCH